MEEFGRRNVARVMPGDRIASNAWYNRGEKRHMTFRLGENKT